MIDFKKYKNQGFNEWQMEELKTATKNKVPDELIETYLANVDYDYKQMVQVREGLVARVDVSLYANKDIPDYCMELIKNRLIEIKKTNNIANEQIEQVNIEQQRLDNKDHIKIHKTLTIMKLGIKLLLFIVILLFVLIGVIYVRKEILKL